MHIEMTAEDFLDSLTGFEEIAIAKAFGQPVVKLSDDQMLLGRALIFVAKKRDGMTDTEAKTAALSMTWGEVTASFAEEEDEPMPEEPVTELGKDDEMQLMLPTG